jgi:hypothetical protein
MGGIRSQAALSTGGKDTGFLDIAKIFAGALAGSTTSTAISTVRSQRRTR